MASDPSSIMMHDVINPRPQLHPHYSPTHPGAAPRAEPDDYSVEGSPLKGCVREDASRQKADDTQPQAEPVIDATTALLSSSTQPHNPTKIKPHRARAANSNAMFGPRASGKKPYKGLKRIPSLKLKRSIASKTLDRPVYQNNLHPSITITMDSDEESLYSDYISPEVNYRNHRVQFIGDDASLYGTPKDLTQEKFTVEPPVRARTGSFLRDQIISFFQPSDNKLAMKLFGNKNALMKEKMRHRNVGNWVIHPCSNFRFYWDLFMLVLLIANLIILPVAISFFNDDLSSHWIIFNCISDAMFFLDIVINFRTGVITDDFIEDSIILEPKAIAKHYMRTWFFLDMISTVPVDYIFLMWDTKANFSKLFHAGSEISRREVPQYWQGRALRMLRLVKLLSLLRLLRLSRLVRYVHQWEEFLALAGKFLRIFNLICLMMLLGHWNGCLQFLVPMLQDFPSDCWVAIEELQEVHWTKQYTWALFKALSHMLCIGYGRFPPQGMTDMWITIGSMLSGATFYALFLGHTTTIIQSYDTSRRLYNEKLKEVEEYMMSRKLPRKLRERIADYYEHKYQGKMFDERAIFNELNDCLKSEIVNHNCRSLVASVPFFTNADHNFVSEVVGKLTYEVYQAGDFIITEGTVGDSMFFIQEGIVDVITGDGEVATSLSDGSYFGEICLLTNTKRTASVRAATYVHLYKLSVDHFNSVLDHYPVMRRTMESVAAERLLKIGKNPSIVSSRADLEEDQKMLNEIVMESTPIGTSASEDEDRDSDDSYELTKPKRSKFRFDFPIRPTLHKIHEDREGRCVHHHHHHHSCGKPCRSSGCKQNGWLEFLERKPHKSGPARLSKVVSGPNLRTLKVPDVKVRTRSGSVGELGIIRERPCSEHECDMGADEAPKEIKHRKSLGDPLHMFRKFYGKRDELRVPEFAAPPPYSPVDQIIDRPVELCPDISHSRVSKPVQPSGSPNARIIPSNSASEPSPQDLDDHGIVIECPHRVLSAPNEQQQMASPHQEQSRPLESNPAQSPPLQPQSVGKQPAASANSEKTPDLPSCDNVALDESSTSTGHESKVSESDEAV